MMIELLESGVSVDSKDDYGETALMKASFHGYEEMVKMLLQKVSESSSGNVEMVKTSLSRIVNLKNNKGKTALMMAICLFRHPRTCFGLFQSWQQMLCPKSSI